MKMFGNRGTVIRGRWTENISDNKPHRIVEIKAKRSIDGTKRPLKADMSPSVMQNFCVMDKQHHFRHPRPRPTFLELSTRNYSDVRRRPLLTRQELLQEKVLNQELAARLAEAKLALLGPDASQELPETGTHASRRRSKKRQQPSHHVSFLSVSKRVANIIRFRQAVQSQNSGGLVEKENSTLEAAENLPKTPRFSSYMSAAAQYALMKGYEDVIFEKLSSKFPESTTTLKRNKTPHHSIAISDKSNFAEKLTNLNAKSNSKIKDSTEDDFSMNSARRTGNNKGSVHETRITTKSDISHVSDLPPKRTEDFQDTPGKASDETKKTTGGEISESFILNKSISSFLPNITKPSQTSLRPSAQNRHCLPDKTHRASLVSTEHFPEIVSLASPEALRRDRRIVLSYRIENAMDILDTIKTKSEQALSPRVKCQRHRHIAPLRDFNRWTDQWATEFNSDVVK